MVAWTKAIAVEILGSAEVLVTFQRWIKPTNQISDRSDVGC